MRSEAVTCIILLATIAHAQAAAQVNARSMNLVALGAVALTPQTSAPLAERNSCTPVFQRAEYHRGDPYSFVDQGLASIPHLFPKHVLLAQRRDSQLGSVDFSLLVYRADADKPDVWIEGMALEGKNDRLRAWIFMTRCAMDNFAEGLVTTLEQVAQLAKRP
jgi:hypothetical protein